MRTIRFFENNRSDNKLHIELPGCIVNITIGLTDRLGRAVTSIRISPDDESRGGDGNGYYWRQVDASRVIRDLLPGLHGNPSPTAGDCRYCGARIEQGDDHLWADVTDGWDGELDPNRDEADRLSCPKAPRRDSGLYPGLHEPVGAEEISAARAWISDSFSDVDVADLTDDEVREGVAGLYDGGWRSFILDGGGPGDDPAANYEHGH